MKTLYAAKTIEVGVHPHLVLFGLTFDYDILMSTALATAVFLFLALRLTKQVTDGVPGKLQIFWEMIVEMVSGVAVSAMGERGKRYVPLGVTLFLFILICNSIGFLPSAMHPGQSGEILPSPTSDINLPLAMAALVIISVHVTSIKTRGIGGYLKHYAQPSILMLPINIIEELTKPITLTFRLFGNVFAGGLMISVMTALLPIWAFPPFEFGWKLFDMFIGAIQAFIFALLTIIYFGMALDNPEH